MFRLMDQYILVTSLLTERLIVVHPHMLCMYGVMSAMVPLSLASVCNYHTCSIVLRMCASLKSSLRSSKMKQYTRSDSHVYDGYPDTPTTSIAWIGEQYWQP